MDMGLSMARNGRSMLNSISGERERYDIMVPLIRKYNPKVVALCMNDKGVPDTADDRLRVAREIVEKLKSEGVETEDIYLDPLVKALSTGDNAAFEVLESIKMIKSEIPDVHMIAAISNISFGLPVRKLLNRVFIVQSVTLGMDGFIMDPLDKTLMGYLVASRSLLGRDEFCTEYLKAYRSGKLE